MPLVKEIVKFAIETLVFQNGSIGSKETLKWRSFHLRNKTSSIQHTLKKTVA